MWILLFQLNLLIPYSLRSQGDNKLKYVSKVYFKLFYLMEFHATKKSPVFSTSIQKYKVS